MSQRGVERTLGKLVTDQGFCDDFFRNPAQACLRIGVDLSLEEADALLRIPRRMLTDLSARLDDRICKPHINDGTSLERRQ